MDAKTRAKILTSTQDHLEILDVADDLVLTKGGGVAIIIQTTAVNFDLLSEYEQDNKIYAFAGLLNSLNFHIQILIRTHRIDISGYVNYLKEQLQSKMTEGLRKQLTIYTQFVQNLIIQNDVLDKKFYIVVPYNPGMTLSGAKMKSTGAAAAVVNPDRVRILEQGCSVRIKPKGAQHQHGYYSW